MLACHARPSLASGRKRPVAGFTYLLLLWWVAIAGVMLMAISQNWVMTRRREREADLLFVTSQIQAALERYHDHPPGDQPKVWPKQLSDLLEDRRGPHVVRHLRQIWRDPITGQARWGLVREHNLPTGGIVGVYSLSRKPPLRAPVGVMRYDEWQFLVADPDGSAASVPVNKQSPSTPSM